MRNHPILALLLTSSLAFGVAPYVAPNGSDSNPSTLEKPFASVAVVSNKIPAKVYGFDLNQVQLLDGPFKHAQELDRENLLKADLDYLCYPFRREAKLPSPVKGIDKLGWPYTGHVLGHFLSASAMLWRNTSDAEIKKHADSIVAILAECQAANGNGYIGGFPEKSILELEGLVSDKSVHADVPWYCLHKIYAGLLDMYVLTGNKQALEVLEKAAGWIEKNLSLLNDQQIEKMLGTEHGGMKEVLVNLYAVTGKENYLKLAERFTHHAVVDPFLQGTDPLDGLHANTQFPKFIGLTRQYEVTGDAALANVVTTFWSDVVNDRSYVTGGNSVREHFSPKGHLSENVTADTTETCNEYNMLRLTRELFCLDAQPKYADFYERTLYNQILSARHPEDGGQLYFQQLQAGRSKEKWGQISKGGASCCCGTGLESAAKFADSIYFHDGQNRLFINLFISSVLDWKENGLSLRQENQYPEVGKTKFTFTCRQPVAIVINVRRPWWATADFQILVNGQRQDIASKPGSYVPLERTWQSGDNLEVIMPLSFRMEGFTDNPDRVAVMFGPLVMAAVTEKNNRYAAINGDRAHLFDDFKSVAGKPLEFTAPPEAFRTSAVVVANKPVRFKPLLNMVNESYAVYWEVITK